MEARVHPDRRDAASPLSPAARRALRDAAARVLERRPARAAETAERSEQEQQLAALLDAVESGVVTDPAEIHAGRLALRRKLLDRLRAELVHGWTGARPDDTDTVLELLRALELHREALDPGSGDELHAPFGGTDEMSLLVGMAHDVRSPLTSILFLADAMRRRQYGNEDEMQRRQLGIIYSAAFGLLSLVSDVVELAKGGGGLSHTDHAPFSVSEIIANVHDIVQPMAEEKRLTMRRLSPDEDYRVGYPVALSRVLLNLTTNAVKFTEDGFVELLAQTTKGNRIEFSVRDTGKGIPPDELPSLWQPLRYDRGRNGFRFSSTGIGLTLSRELVEAMGSTLHVETRPDWGTRFYFELDLPPVRDH